MKEKEGEKQVQPVDPGQPAEHISKFRWYVPAILAALVLAAGLCLWVFFFAVSVPSTSRDTAVTVYIRPGAGFSGIKKNLISNKVVADDIRFDIVAQVLGAAGKMQAGEYLFPPNLSHRDIIRKLTSGDVYYQALTIPEGATSYQIAELLAARFGFGATVFLQRVHDVAFIKSLGLSVDSLEGYLFPDTYFVTRGQSVEAIIAMLVRRFHQVQAEIAASAPNSSSFLSPHERVILASIVEKETALPEERPLIAAVFINRLKKKMKLQADPTVIYGMRDFAGNLTRQDLRTPTPYNTYILKGLPAGPIANPGKEALLAVLHPAPVGYLYFVAKNDGSHHFSKTLSEHNRAVRHYQKKR